MSFRERVQEHLMGLENMRDCNLQSVLTAFGMGNTQFQRRLREEGANFRALADAEKARRLDILLRRYSKAPMCSVAKLLGYRSNESAKRGVERIYGVPFSELRRRA